MSSFFKSVQQQAEKAAAAAQDVQRRVTQQALEAAGIAEKTEDDDEPELVKHHKLDKFLKTLYERTDKYMRAVNGACDMTYSVADDFVDVLENGSLCAAAEQFREAASVGCSKNVKVLNQVLHRKVFQPVRRDVDGRKEYEKRLVDRKKVRLDYDAYRRKQQGYITSDPANKQEYEANLEQARKTFERHSQGVLRDVATVNRERESTAAAALMGMLCSQLEFHKRAAEGLQQAFDAVGRSLSGEEGQMWASVQRDVADVAAQVGSGRASQPSAPQQAQAQAQQAQAQAQQQAAAAAAAEQRSRRSSAPELTPTRPAQAPPPAPPPAQSSYVPPTVPSAAPDPFGLFADAPPAPAPAPPPPAPRQESTPDLLSGFASPAASSSPPPQDLMGNADPFGGPSSALDDLMSLGAPAALVPQAAAAPHRSQSQSAGAMPVTRPAVSVSAPNAAAAGFDPFGLDGVPNGAGSPDLMGNMGAPSNGRPRSVPKSSGFASGGFDAFGEPDLFGAAPSAPVVDANGELNRSALAARREAEKQAAIDEKVEELRAANDKLEQNRETERELEKVVKQKVGQWQRDKKNLRALLASLHEIAPPCQWKPVTMADLIDPSKVKRSYHKALLAVHPDKQPPDDLPKKVLAQHVFDALRESWHIFEKTG